MKNEWLNKLRLVATFQNPPTPEKQQLIEEQLRSFLSEIAPEMEVTVHTGSGSWWIETVGSVAVVGGGWLMLQLGAWVVQRGMDYVLERVKKREQPSTNLSQSLPQSEESESEIETPFENNNMFNTLAWVGSQYKKVADTIGEDDLTITLWELSSRKSQAFVISGRVNKGKLLSLNAYQLDDPDEDSHLSQK